jgi:hypothetical protein
MRLDAATVLLVRSWTINPAPGMKVLGVIKITYFSDPWFRRPLLLNLLFLLQIPPRRSKAARGARGHTYDHMCVHVRGMAGRDGGLLGHPRAESQGRVDDTSRPRGTRMCLVKKKKGWTSPCPMPDRLCFQEACKQIGWEQTGTNREDPKAASAS